MDALNGKGIEAFQATCLFFYFDLGSLFFTWFCKPPDLGFCRRLLQYHVVAVCVGKPKAGLWLQVCPPFPINVFLPSWVCGMNVRTQRAAHPSTRTVKNGFKENTAEGAAAASGGRGGPWSQRACPPNDNTSGTVSRVPTTATGKA